jgi:hypothetical protein
MNKEATPKDVALFMKTELDKKKCLYQEDIVFDIERKFGSQFVCISKNGTQGIDSKLLLEFRKITPNVVWERGERCWRLRERNDEPRSRMQD